MKREMRRELIIALVMSVAIAGILLVDHVKKVRKERLFKQMREDTFMQPVVHIEEDNQINAAKP